MFVLGLKYREFLPCNREDLRDVSEASDNEKLCKMIGEDPETNNPINVLHYAQDSRFMGAFNRVTNPPTCHEESLLKPVGCETFAENEHFNDYLVSEIEDAQRKIDDVRREKKVAMEKQIEQIKQSQQIHSQQSVESSKTD